ncbi:MAG: glutamine amidotransferase [Tepidisphaeraceae bacterium]|jgi:uncharacterized membrane protein
MQRLLEILLGLKNGFLSQQGSVSIQFNPTWPWQQYVGGAAVWNLLLAAAGLALVIYVYRREGRSRRAKIVLGVLRCVALALVLILLNRPVLALGQVHREPSVLAILVDDSISMKVKDVTGPDAKPQSRLDAVIDLLGADDGRLLRRLAAVHTLRLFDFSRGSREIADLSGPASVPQAVQALQDLKPEGDGTQVVASVHSVLEELQGQRLAGVVVFSDGRDTPSAALPEAVAADKSFGVNIYPVPVGTDRMPQNIAVQSVDYEPIAFVDDVTDFHLSVRATGYEPNHPITLMLMRQSTKDGQTTLVPARDQDGREISKIVTAPDDRPFDVELQYKPTAGDMPTANLAVLAKPQEGELDDADNLRPVQLAVLDDKISMLYVEGYPRWDYRYLKNAMLRDRTVKISCLLTSADPAFRQEGSDDPDRPGRTWAITAFPTTLEQLLDYDVVVLGDVDPRQFTDAQLQLISDFVSKKGGGFAMVAGPRFSPQSYRNTPIEPLLPVIITHTEADDSKSAITEGFRPVLTPAGAQSSIFRFFADEAANQEYLKNHLQELFWYCRGVMVKPGVGIVYAEHPTDLGPDNRKAPILVLGRFGAGRTIFSAIDDSWRWRFYTGESIFNTYWIEQLRYLARGRKLGQRKLEFTADQDSYELGKQITLRVRLLSPQLIEQVSPPIGVQIVADATGQAVRRVDLLRQGGASELYSASFTADQVGQFSAKLTHLTDQEMLISYNVQTPQLELDQPQVDAAAMSRLASDAPIPLAQAGQKLAAIPSAAKVIPVEVSQPLWNAPLALALLAGAITAEWIVRKMLGML